VRIAGKSGSPDHGLLLTGMCPGGKAVLSDQINDSACSSGWDSYAQRLYDTQTVAASGGLSHFYVLRTRGGY
jgi:hypothetical protein